MIPSLLLLSAGCGTPRLSAEEMQDPAVCADCHPDHHREWSGSMHAYASADPVFRALNALGQAETDGDMGDFCVRCHAPLAVELGLTTDGLNLDEVPEHLQGINCYFCHQVEQVGADHNNGLTMAMDRTLRGGHRDPVRTRAHDSAYSELHDRTAPASNDLCGSCHDVVTPLGARIERTYEEWEDSIFSDPVVGLSCGECHMRGRDGIAAEVEGVPLRRIHDHRFPGVDLALTPWPEREDQRAAVQDFLDDSVSATLCVQPSAGSSMPVVVTLDNLGAGHSFPSGATSDRRVWVQLEAFSGETRVWSSGAVSATEPLTEHEAAASEPVWSIYSELLTSDGAFTHKFWEAADIDNRVDDQGNGGLLRAHTTLDTTDPDFFNTFQTRTFVARGEEIDRIRMSVHIRPLPLDLVNELVEDGWLDSSVRDELPTFTLSPTIQEWTPEAPINSGNLACVPAPPAGPLGQ